MSPPMADMQKPFRAGSGTPSLSSPSVGIPATQCRSTPEHRYSGARSQHGFKANGLDDKALASLCQVYRRNDEDEIQRVLAGLRRGVPGKGRTAVSWEPLVSALPLDVDRRLAAMDAELAALPPRQRDKRLAQVRQQIPLLRQVLVHFEDYDRRYSIRDE